MMPFGLTNAPSSSQSLMNAAFKPHLRKFVLVFFDDILVYNETWFDHLHHLWTALALLRHNQLFAKKSKCVFGKASLEYLGYIISDEGVFVDPVKVHAMDNSPRPQISSPWEGFWGELDIIGGS